MKFCTHCGTELFDEAVVCPKCGCSAEPGRPVTNAPKTQPTKAKVYSPLSIVGFIFAFVFPLAGLICSVIAFKNAQVEGNDRCKNFAKAGIIISAILLALEVISNLVLEILRACNVEISYYWNYWRLFWDLLF